MGGHTMGLKVTVSRTYLLQPETAERIAQLAAELQSYSSPLADLLLTRALDEIAAGRWELGRQPIKFYIDWKE